LPGLFNGSGFALSLFAAAFPLTRPAAFLPQRIRRDPNRKARSGAAVVADKLSIGGKAYARVGGAVIVGRFRDLEQPERAVRDTAGRRAEFAHKTDIVEDINGPAEGADNEIGLPGVYFQVKSRYGGQSCRPSLPLCAPVDAVPQAELGARPDQARGFGVGASAVDGPRHVTAVDEPRPAFAEIGGAVQVGLPVVAPVVIDHDQRLARR